MDGKLAARPAFTLDLRYDKALEFDSLAGQRGFFRVIEGTASGERFNGRVIDDGGDWIAFRTDGVVETDTRMILQSDEGHIVYLRSRGVLRAGTAALTTYLRDKTIDAGGAYYRTAPWFDTAVGPADWLTKSVFVGVGRFEGSHSRLDIHEVL